VGCAELALAVCRVAVELASLHAARGCALALLTACSSAELELELERELANGGELAAPELAPIGPRPAPVDDAPPAARRVVHHRVPARALPR
jgi:hypothetical protein